MNGQTSGRSSAAPKPSANAWPWWSSEVALDREQDERDQQALGVAHHRVAEEVGRQEQPDRRDQARGHAGAAAADQPARQPEAHDQREQAARAGDDQPQVGRGVAEEREDGGEQDRQRLPRRAGVGVQLELDDVAAPLDPRPRVVARRRGVEQRQRGQRQRGGDRDRERVVAQPCAPGARIRGAAAARARTARATAHEQAGAGSVAGPGSFGEVGVVLIRTGGARGARPKGVREQPGKDNRAL